MSSLQGVHSATILTDPNPPSRLLFATRTRKEDFYNEFLPLTEIRTTQGALSLGPDSEGVSQAVLAWTEADGTQRERSTAEHSEDLWRTMYLERGTEILYMVNGLTVDTQEDGDKLLQMGYSSPDIDAKVEDGWEVVMADKVAISHIHPDPETHLMAVDSTHYKAATDTLQQKSPPSCFRAKAGPDGHRGPLVFAECSKNNDICQITENIDNFPATLHMNAIGSEVSWIEQGTNESGSGKQTQERSTLYHPDDKAFTMRLAVPDTHANRFRRRLPLSINPGKQLTNEYGGLVTEQVEFYASNCYEVDNQEELAKLRLSEGELKTVGEQLALGGTLWAADALVTGGNLGSTFSAFIDKGSEH